MTRRLPIGAEPQPGGSAHFRVWAPKRSRVEVLLDSGDAFPLGREESGYHSGTAPVAAGALYRYRLDGQDAFPDPASRFQPNGPHGPSQVIDPDAFQWTDGEWRGLTQRGQVLYELHVGAFTQEGTWDSARGRLQHLAE